MRRVTRGLKTAVLQQQQMVDAEAAVQVLVQKTPPLEVDRNKLKVYHRVHIEAHTHTLYRRSNKRSLC